MKLNPSNYNDRNEPRPTIDCLFTLNYYPSSKTKRENVNTRFYNSPYTAYIERMRRIPSPGIELTSALFYLFIFFF